MTSVHIDELNLNLDPDTPRVTNALKREGIEFIDQLARKTAEDLVSIRNIGENDIPRIKDALAQYGLHLAR